MLIAVKRRLKKVRNENSLTESELELRLGLGLGGAIDKLIDKVHWIKDSRR
jgi:hypothetical protein